MEQKYVIFADDAGKEYAVIFDRDLAHVDVARAMSRAKSEWSRFAGFLEPVSAGFVGDDKRGSESLKMGPRPEDGYLLGVVTERQPQLTTNEHITKTLREKPRRSLFERAKGARGRA